MLQVSSPAFRYEKPQAGRLRQFHQHGVELSGEVAVGAVAGGVPDGLPVPGSVAEIDEGAAVADGGNQAAVDPAAPGGLLP